MDYYWARLSEGGQEVTCGWLKDKYGLSWQVIPGALIDMISDPDPGQGEAGHRGDARDDQARHSDAPEGVCRADMKPAVHPILELEDLTRWPRPYSATPAGQIPACSQRCVAFSNKYATWNPSSSGCKRRMTC